MGFTDVVRLFCYNMGGSDLEVSVVTWYCPFLPRKLFRFTLHLNLARHSTLGLKTHLRSLAVQGFQAVQGIRVHR